MSNILLKINTTIKHFILSVPVRWKIIGIGVIPVIILGGSLNYWITTGLSDWLSYILTDVRVEAAMSSGSRSVLFVTVIAAFFSIILLALLVHILNTPIDALKETAEEVAAGNYDSRAEIWARDEIGVLATSINQMIDNFVAIQEDLSQTNRQLAVINRIGLAADRENEIHDVLFITLESLINLHEFEFGWVYLYDPEVDKHHLASWKNIPTFLEQHLLDISGRDFCTCQEKLVTQSLEDDILIIECSRLKAARYPVESARHITIPIEARGIQFGVINLYYPFSDPLSEELRDSLDSIGTKVSEVVANAWLQIKIREKEAARQLLLESLVTAQEDERSHLARELHDQAGQGLTSLLIRLKALEKKCDRDDLKENLLNLQSLVSQTIDQMRDLSYSLRPPALEEFGLGAAINSLADEISAQAGIRVKLKNRLEKKLPRNLEMVLYRIVQEGLTNVIRHANATHVMIELEPREKHIHLKLKDDGQGFDPAKAAPKTDKQHLGLISMHERAELIGGKLDMYSKEGSGTTIEVNVPLSAVEIIHDK
jgi:signal transduction histidine kinase